MSVTAVAGKIGTPRSTWTHFTFPSVGEAIVWFVTRGMDWEWV